MKYLWITDPHLNFLEQQERQQFYNQLKVCNADGIFITGDIAEAPNVVEIILELINYLDMDVYFVLGNHDYYRSDVATVRSEVRSSCAKNKMFHWLPVSGPINLSEAVVLIGQDGWADGRYGDFVNSRVMIADSRMIQDLFAQRMLNRMKLLDKMQELADQDAAALEKDLFNASAHNPKKIIVLTHVPPYIESCMHEGEISNDDWLPFFCF